MVFIRNAAAATFPPSPAPRVRQRSIGQAPDRSIAMCIYCTYLLDFDLSAQNNARFLRTHSVMGVVLHARAIYDYNAILMVGMEQKTAVLLAKS